MRNRAVLRPAAAGDAMAFAASIRGRGSRNEKVPRSFSLVFLQQRARQETRQQQIKIQHTVKMMLQAHLRGQSQTRRSGPSTIPAGQVVQAVLPRLVKGLGDHVLRHVRRVGAAPPYRVPASGLQFPAGLAFYRPERSVALAFRREGRSPAELHHQVQRITRHVQSRVAQQITQTLPWRSHLTEALRSPEVVRQLTDQLTRAFDRHADIERYRRGA